MRQAQQKGKTMFGFKQKLRKELNDIWSEIYKLNNFQAKIENAVPTFNNLIEKYKELDEDWTVIYKLCEKMDEKITKLEKNIKGK